MKKCRYLPSSDSPRAGWVCGGDDDGDDAGRCCASRVCARARVHVLQHRGTSSASVMELSAMNGGGEIVSFGH